MTDKIVFDASAMIMLFAKEPGFEKVKNHLKTAIISAVNLAEVYKYCIETQQLSETECRYLMHLSGVKIIDFSEEQSLISASIVEQTKSFGLSLGDRACIALAIFKKCPILTCDRAWEKVDLDLQILMAR